MKVKFSEDVTQDDGVEFKKDKSYDLRDSSARHWINRNKALPDEKADAMASYLASDKAQEKSEGTSPKPDLAHSVQEAQRAQREQTTVQPKTPDRAPDPAISEGLRGTHSAAGLTGKVTNPAQTKAK